MSGSSRKGAQAPDTIKNQPKGSASGRDQVGSKRKADGKQFKPKQHRAPLRNTLDRALAADKAEFLDPDPDGGFAIDIEDFLGHCLPRSVGAAHWHQAEPVCGRTLT